VVVSKHQGPFRKQGAPCGLESEAWFWFSQRGEALLLEEEEEEEETTMTMLLLVALFPPDLQALGLSTVDWSLLESELKEVLVYLHDVIWFHQNQNRWLR